MDGGNTQGGGGGSGAQVHYEQTVRCGSGRAPGPARSGMPRRLRFSAGFSTISFFTISTPGARAAPRHSN